MFDLHLGDCRDVMAAMPANSVDTIITDPPYGLEFMGKDWDKLGAYQGPLGNGEDEGPWGRRNRVRYGSTAATMQEWHRAWAAEALRVAKPGAMLLAFGGTRTFHRLTCAIEDAGWEIRDCAMWLYGSGFPKSHDISKAIDKAAGAEREDAVKGGHKGMHTNQDRWSEGHNALKRTVKPQVNMGALTRGTPVTPLAATWVGWGTALKPAWEPIILAMKPLDGTFAQNAEKWGVAGLNIDGGRIGAAKDVPASGASKENNGYEGGWGGGVGREQGTGFDASTGRWPANLLLDEEAAAMLDEQSGVQVSGTAVRRNLDGRRYQGNAYGEYVKRQQPDMGYGDSGGASRFFYVAKASRREREQGLEGLEERLTLRYSERAQGPLPQQTPSIPSPQRNHHPTVKPIALMEYLCRLTATPTGGVVLDPFMGSGSTGIAALKTGRTFIGIEQNEEYLDIARRRLDWWARQLRDNDKPLPLWVGDIADNEPEAGGGR